MRSANDTSLPDLDEAHRAANALLSGRVQACLPGPMLPLLLGGLRDELRGMLGLELGPPLRHRVPPERLGALTSAELQAATSAVVTLLAGRREFMGDPLLPRLLGEFRDAVVIEKAERDEIRDELTAKAKAS